jgi:hypothetical protein
VPPLKHHLRAFISIQELHLTAVAHSVYRVQRPPWPRGREMRAGTRRIGV